MTDTTTHTGKSDLFLKLANIIGEIKAIPKSGHNDFHNYDYVTANDLINSVRDKLSAAGVFVFTSVETQEVREVKSTGQDGKEKSSFLTLVTLKHTFCSAETGETFSVLSQGQGADVGDKGGYKAITGAMKYFIYKCFMIPTDEDGTELLDERRPTTTSSATTGSGTKPSVPRGSLDWREVEIHFGTYKGTELGKLSDGQLRAWFNWRPNPKYKATAADSTLLAAIELAAAELNP